MTVTALRTLRQTGDDGLTGLECPICGGKNGQHEFIRVPYPYPFNKAVFKYAPCPLEAKDE